MPWKIGLLGTGNLASFWAREITRDKGNRLYVKGSDAFKTGAFCRSYTSQPLVTPHSVDFYLVAVQNDAIDSVIRELPTSKPVFICAGFHQDASPHVGYLYPLQSLHKENLPDIREIPFLIDAKKPLRAVGEAFITSLNASFRNVTTEERLRCHLAAVFINNFGYCILKEGMQLIPGNIEPKMFEPILKNTLSNTLQTADLQTGPARRKDLLMMEKQVELLEKVDPRLVKLYRELSQFILQKYHEL